jgi:hemerythrin-like metal-binding protein
MAEWVVWSPEWRIGEEKIDRRHEDLFRMFNELGDALWDGVGKDKIGEMLQFAADYTVVHFTEEERVMLENGCERLAEHKKIHKDFVAEVLDALRRFKSGENSTEFVVKLVMRLGDWLRDHVRGIDQEIGKCLRAKASRPVS